MPYALLLLLLAFFQVETLAYLAVNGVASRLPGVPLLTAADRVLPVRPRSLWLYLSFVPYCLLSVFDFGSLRRVARLLVCVALEALVSYRGFLKFPARYPRPPVRGDDARLDAAWRALIQADRPANTFPSVHVGHAFLLALAASHHVSRSRSDALLLWASLITASTLTTKQHFLVDLTGGVVAAEAIVTHVYEPWEEGRLSWREARLAMRRLCERLDGMARAPEQARLRADERHPRLRQFLGTLACQASLVDLYDTTRARHRLIGQGRWLARLLNRAGRFLSLLIALVPGWLQFARQFQEAAPVLSDRRLAAYLRENEPDLRRALDLLFELEPSGGPGRGLSPASATPPGPARAA